MDGRFRRIDPAQTLSKLNSRTELFDRILSDTERETSEVQEHSHATLLAEGSPAECAREEERELRVQIRIRSDDEMGAFRQQSRTRGPMQRWDHSSDLVTSENRIIKKSSLGKAMTISRPR
jgi:hypothetical protein